jgi:hypothetical protein
MKVGDLVCVDKQIDEYFEELGDTVGIIINAIGPALPNGHTRAPEKQTTPMLTDVLWSNGDVESFYTDELELINVNQ